MEHNIEPSSSDDDDCRLVLGPQFGRKLKRPVKPQTGRETIKKPRNDFSDLITYLGDNNECEPNASHFDSDLEEITCLVEDCRHNKSSIGEENNNTTAENEVNEQKTFVTNQPSTSKTNVQGLGTEFKVPNPVGPAKKRKSKKKKEQLCVPNQSKTLQNYNALRTNRVENSTTNDIIILDSSTSSSSISSKSIQSNSSSSNKSVFSTKIISSNSSNESENNSFKKSSISNSIFLNSSNQTQNKISKKSNKSKALKKSNADSESSNSNSSNSGSNDSNATSSDCKKSKRTNIVFNKSNAINIPFKKIDETNSECSKFSVTSSSSNKSNVSNSSSNKSNVTSLASNKSKRTNSGSDKSLVESSKSDNSKGTSLESNKSNATSSGSNVSIAISSASRISDSSSLGSYKSKGTSSESDKSFTTSSSAELIIISSDDSESKSNIKKISNAMLANAVAEAEVKAMNEKLNKSVKKLTIGFVKLFTKNAEDIDILGDNDDTFTASGKFEVENKIKKRTYPDGTTGLELHMTILTTLFSSVPSQNNDTNNHTDSDNLNNDKKTSNNSKVNKDTKKKTRDFRNDEEKNYQKPDNFGKVKDNANNGKIRKNNKRRKNRNQMSTEVKSQKINEQDNNGKPKQVNINGNHKFVDPNQPSTSKNYDPSCILAVPSTSKCINSHLNENAVSSGFRGNKMDVDSSNGSEKPEVESENLSVADLAVPGCSNEFIKAEQRQAFKQIKSAVGAWIKQCIDNVPIKRPLQEKEIMHEKVLRALSKKLRLLYNNCYDILRNKKMQIIVPVSEDPNSDKFKPIIILSSNNKAQNIMLDTSVTNSESPALERDTAVSSDTDAVGPEQSSSRDKEEQNNINDDTIIISDDDSFSSQSIHCDIESTSEDSSPENNCNESTKDSSASHDTLDDILEILRMSNTKNGKNDNNSDQKVNKKEQNENINNVEVMEENNGCSSKSNSEKQNTSKPEDDTVQVSSLNECVGEPNNSEGGDGSEEHNSYEADIDDLNSSTNENETNAPNLVNNENCSPNVYYKRKGTHNDECKSQPSSNNKENQIQIVDTSSDSEDDFIHDHNYCEKRTSSMEISNESSSEDGLVPQNPNNQTTSEQCPNIDNSRISQGNIERNNLRILHPTQIIHGQCDTVSNNSSISKDMHLERFREPRNPQPNLYTRVSNERDQSCNDNNQNPANNHVCCLPRFVGDVTKFAANGGLGSLLPTATPIWPTENSVQKPPTTHSENSSQMHSLNSTSIPITTSNTTFTQSPIFRSSPNIEISSTSRLPVQEIVNPRLSTYQTIPDGLFGNNASSSAMTQQSSLTNQNSISTQQDAATITISTQTLPVVRSNREDNFEFQQPNNLTAEITPNAQSNPNETEWALSDSDSSDSDITEHNETDDHTAETTNPIGELSLERYQNYIENHRIQLLHHIEGLRARQVAIQQSTMRDSHRNLWLRQQHQLETMRRHAVRGLADRPVTRSITQARRYLETAAASNSISPETVRPRPFRFSVVHQILDFHRAQLQRNRLFNNESSPPTMASIQAALRQSNTAPQPEVLDQNRSVNSPFRPISMTELRNMQQVDGNNDDHEPTDAARESIDNPLAMERFNPGRLFFANIERNPSMRRRNTDLIFDAIRRMAAPLDQNNEEDVEDEDYRAANAMPLQELVDNTTVVFQYDGTTQEERCNICLCEYVRDEMLRRLPCFHTYHRNCIDQWLGRERRTCPNCRTYLSSHLCYDHNNP